MSIFWGFLVSLGVLVVFGAAILAVLLLDRKEERETRWGREPRK